jgi:hypothetical protein
MEDAAEWLEKHCVLCWKEERFQCVRAGLRKERIEDNDLYAPAHDHGVVRENTYTGKLTITGHIAVDMPTWFK